MFNQIVEKHTIPHAGEVYLRVMSCKEREEFWKATNEGNCNVEATLASFVVCDESGKRLYSAEQMKEANGIATKEIWKAATKLNRLLAEHVDDAKKN